MKINVGKTDQIIRLILGAVMIVLGILIHWSFYLVAAASIVTAFTGFCGIYALFGITTCPRQKPKL
jgi:hypothetical protein